VGGGSREVLREPGRYGRVVDAISLLVEAFGRVPGLVRGAVDGLDEEELAWRPDPGANSVAWLVWHLARQQDAQVAALAGQEQEWTAGGWAGRAGLPFDDREHGYGMDAEDVAAVRLPADLLVGYAEAVHRVTVQHLSTLAEESLDEVVDEHWDPPVTRGVRLVSVLDDAVQHAGQAAYLRGLLQRRR
jgi:hypothetical protein